MAKVIIHQRKAAKTFETIQGIDLLRAYQLNSDLPLRFGCCEGKCGACAIEVIKGAENLSKMGKNERDTLQAKGYNENHRLACQCAIMGNIEIG